MPATLNIQPLYYDPSIFHPEYDVRAAFNAWLGHFDYTAGSYDLKVSFGRIPGGIISSVGYGGDAYAQVGSSAGMAVVLPVFGLNVTGRNGTTPATPTLTFSINQVGDGATIRSNLIREFEHAFGVQSSLDEASSEPAGSRTVYDGSIITVPYPPGTYFSPYSPPPGPNLAFAGPNAQAVYGGSVPLLPPIPNITAVSRDQGVPTVNTFLGPNAYPPPAAPTALDVAMLRDAGLPALSDQEIVEHQIARLYFAAYGRVATGMELTGSTRYYNAAVAAGQAPAALLATIGAALVSDPALASNLASLSPADFVRTTYQNTFGRDPDAQTASAIAQYVAGAGTAGRGAALAALTDTDEARGRLSANANVTYAGTVEAQVARLYDTAFGRAADPGGYAQYTRALINGFTLKQAALSFLGSAEFASRYGAAPSDQALVDALYTNTLGRAPDAAGEAQYLRALSSGGFDRADLVVAFSESAEHIGIVAARASARDASGLFLSTQPVLGVIPVLSGTTSFTG